MLLLALLVSGLWAGPAAALTVKSVTGRDQMAVGESLQLQLRLDGIPDVELDLSPLRGNWEVLNSSRSSQRRIVNGSYTSSLVYTLTLMPRTQGSLEVPAICFGTDCSQPLTIDVTTRSTLSLPADKQVLLETSVNTQKIVVQGQLLLKVRLSIRGGLPAGQLSEPQPTGVAVQVKKLTDVRKYDKSDKGLVYQVFERDYAIFPQESGQLLIPALQFDGVIAGGRTRLDPFARQGMQVRRTSQPLEVEVTALPRDLGMRPWIPSNGVVLQDDWQKQRPKLVVGEPVTRTLRLTAGGVQSAQLPELKPAPPDGFKAYPDQPSRRDQLTASGTRAVMEQKIALIPTRAGKFQLPAFNLDWWDMAAGRWRKAHLDALELEVAPAVKVAAVSSPSSASSSSSQKPQPQTEDAVSGTSPVEIPAPVPLVVKKTEHNASFWPWLSLVLALSWLLTLTFIWRARRRKKLTGEATTEELPRDEKTARRALLQAAKKNDPQATRQALILWSRILWPDAGTASYEQLLGNADAELRDELEKLDQSLYGNVDQAWDGARLANRIATWKVPHGDKKLAVLPDLYP